MKRLTCYIVTSLALILPGCMADEIMLDDSEFESRSSAPGELDEITTESYCTSTATCLDGSTISCSGNSVCQAGNDETCSSPGVATCDGQEYKCPSNPLSVSVSCNDSFRRIDCIATASGGSASYSYNWSYSGSASFWNSAGDSAWVLWSPSGCTGYSTFYVTATDSCGNQASDSETVICN